MHFGKNCAWARSLPVDAAGESYTQPEGLVAVPLGRKEKQIQTYYRILLSAWGCQHWWPARTRFEVIVGAYLTQNTAWRNVESALSNLRSARLLNLEGIRQVALPELERLIHCAGYFRQKARRLKTFVAFLDQHYGGSVGKLFSQPTPKLRQELLSLNGVGPETADSILLYAGNYPVFVVDAYTRRKQKNADGIEIQIPDSETVWGVLKEYAQGELQPAIVQRPEFLSEYREWTGKEFPLTLSIAGDVERFSILSHQTFWPDDQGSRDKRLPKSLAILMMGLRVGQICGLLLLLGLGAWFAFFVATAYRGEALRASLQVVSSERAEFDRLTGTKQFLSKWDKILAPRSQAWSIMDFVLGLLPEGNTVICEKLEYAIKQVESKPTGPQSGSPGGFSRQWVIDGFCNDQGRVDLEHLQESSTLAKVFGSTAARLGDPSFAVSGNRSVKAVLREETNSQPGYGSKPDTLPYQFRLVVTQMIPANDPLALPVLPKPKKTAMQ